MLKLSGCPRLTWGRCANGRAGAAELGATLPPGAGRRARRPGSDEALASQPPTAVSAPRRGSECFSAGRARGAHGRPVSAPRDAAAGWGRAPGGSTVRDAQAGVPSAGWPRAQLAFKDSMVHGILQFTPSIAFRYVLHRCESRDIRCRESSKFRTRGGIPAGMPRSFQDSIPWRPSRRGFGSPRGGSGRARPPRPRAARVEGVTGSRVSLLDGPRQ